MDANTGISVSNEKWTARHPEVQLRMISIMRTGKKPRFSAPVAFISLPILKETSVL